MSARRRSGFTMIEALVFLPIATIVLVLAWTFFRQSSVQGKATDVKLQGVQATLIFTLNVERDLDGLYEDANHRVEILDGGRGIRFFRCASPSPEASWDPLPLEKIEYHFDLAGGKLVRQVEGKAPDPIVGCFEGVDFRLDEPVAAPADATQPLPPAPAVVFSAVAVPEEDLGKAMEDRDPRHRTVLFSAVPRRWLAGRAGYPFWNPVPYAPAQPAPAP